MTFMAAAAAKIIIPAVVKAIIAKNTSPAVADKIERAVAEDPVALNEMSAEAPYQSRVAVGSVVAAIGIVVPTVARLLGYDLDGNNMVQFLNALLILWGAGYSLYGRFTNGLKPLFLSK